MPGWAWFLIGVASGVGLLWAVIYVWLLRHASDFWP